MVPFFVLVKVQVMFSPGDTSIAVIGEPSEQAALVLTQPDGTVSSTLNVPGATAQTLVFDRVASASSSRLNAVHPVMLPAKAKSCGSLGIASFTTVMLPPLVFVKVQVMFSPGDTSIAVIGEPSEQTALVLTQPDGTVSSTLNVPGATAQTLVSDRVASASSSRLNAVHPVMLPAKAKSCGSLGMASFTTVMLPFFVFVKVQVMFSP